ncbi:MAG: Hpt domain-containing protein [Bacteroidota bacterium]
MNKQEYTHINLSYLYDIADNDIDFVKEMITDYIIKVPVQFTEMQTVFWERNFEQTHFIAHKIKSAFQFVGAQQLVELARNIERVSETQDIETITQDLAAMEPVVKLVLTELQSELSVL